MMKRTMGGVLAAAMMMTSAIPAVGAVDVSHLNNTGSSSLSQAGFRHPAVPVRSTGCRACDRCQL